jgi:hypothetical protein
MAIENPTAIPQYLKGAKGQEEADAVDTGVEKPRIVETIIDLDRKEILSLLREVQDVVLSGDEEVVVEPDVIWLG